MQTSKALFGPIEKEPGTKENPWKLRTPSGKRHYEMYKDEKDGQEVLVCRVGLQVFHYDYRCITDLYTMLQEKGEWLKLGSVDEMEQPEEGTIEAWARSPRNPIGQWYGLNKGARGNFGIYVAPLMQRLRLAELDTKNDRIKAAC